MKTFINGGDGQFEDLKRRATGACVRFRDTELPPGASPQNGMVGFEVDPRNGFATLLVQHGVSYTGQSREIAEWLRGGEKTFPTFETLRHWISNVLAEAYGTAAVSHGEQPNGGRRLQPSELTDLDAVRGNIKETNGPHYINENVLLDKLSGQVRGQENALRELSRRVYRHWARSSPRRPLTLLAIGPTGVGKTKTAETLPAILRELDSEGGGYAYLRLDLSEYREAHRVSQLLGSPPGYIGHGEGAQLIDFLAANPRSLVLFDEIEKAHPDVLKVLMNAIDCGRISSPTRRANTREIDCRRAIFYFTSNLDSEGILTELERREAFEKSELIDQVCRERFRAAGVASELVGRINCFLVFQPLTQETKAEIVALSVARVAEEYGVRVERVSPELIVTLLTLCKSDGFGARPLEFLIDDKLGGTFSEAALAKVKGPLEVKGGPPFECVAIS
jgi:ATP-dependent Clp protease ATP-binding subunit ClpB